MALKKIRMSRWLLVLMPLVMGCFPSEKMLRIVQRVQLDNSKELFLFHRVSFLHESTETYFGLVQDSCLLFTDSNAVVASTMSYAQVDSVSRDTLFVSSDFEVNAGPMVNGMKIKVRRLMPQDKTREIDSVYFRECK